MYRMAISPEKDVGNHTQFPVVKHKQLQVAGLNVDIMTDSGQINLVNGNSNLVINVDDVRVVSEDDKAGISTKYNSDLSENDFGFNINDKVEEDVELMTKKDTRMISGSVEVTAAIGDKVSFSKELSNGSELKINLFLVSRMGLTTIGNGEAWPVFPGDLKFSFELSNGRSWFEDKFNKNGQYVDIDIKISVANSGNIFPLFGDKAETKLHLSEQYFESKTEGLNSGDTPPKLKPNADGSQSLTFRFGRQAKNNIFHDSFLLWHSVSSVSSLASIRDNASINTQKARGETTFLLERQNNNFDLYKITHQSSAMSSQLFPPVSVSTSNDKSKRFMLCTMF